MFLIEVILGIVLCTGALIWWWQRSARLYWEKNGVSYIPGPPFIGVMKDAVTFKKHFGELLSDLYSHEKFKEDPITGVQFFHQPSLIVRHPEIIKNILVKDFPTFIDRGVKSDPHDLIGRDNLFAATGERWRTIRQKISPVFTVVKLKNLFLLINDVIKVLEEKLSTEIRNEHQEYEIKNLAMQYTIDTIATCAFGIQSNSLQDPNTEFSRIGRIMYEIDLKRSVEFCTCFFFPKVAEILRFKLFSKEANDFLRTTINHVMDERIKSGRKRNDLIDTLISMEEEDSDYFKRDTLVAQAAIFISAGYETTSSAISFALYELARHPEIQEKLRKEIKDYDEKYGSLQYETINEMEYLHSVVQEILRMYPGATFLNRVCLPPDGSKFYSLEPYHKFSIPRGMSVYIPVMAIHRDPKYFPNPLEFIPDRFSPENRDSMNQYTYFAFSHGPRNCIATKLGYLMVKMALFTILRNYKVEATERTPKTIKLQSRTIAMHSCEPLYIKLIKA